MASEARPGGYEVSGQRNYRHQLTLPEVLIWQRLKQSPQGIAFRKQHRIGPYRLDFYCAAAKTAFEIDGIAHDMGGNPQRDEARDAGVAGQGIVTVRISAKDVLNDADAVAQSIVDLCAARISER